MSRGGRQAGDPPTILAALDRHGGRLGDRPAYTFLSDGERVGAALTYGELPRTARAVAAGIQDAAAPGARALLLYPTGPEFLLAFLGCLYAGVVAVPAHPPASGKHVRRLRSIVEDAGANLVLSTAAVARSLRDEPGGVLGGDRELLATDLIDAARAAGWREVPAEAGTLALLQYTSGSTGAPRGVMLTHGNLAHNCRSLREATAHDDAVFVSWLPQFHDMGLIASLLQALFAGVHAVTMRPESFLRDPVRWLRAITTFRGTWSGGPNFAYDLCVRRTDPASREGLDLGCWRAAFNGAEPIRPATLDRFAEAFAPYGFRAEALCPGYGLAESTVYVTVSPVGGGARVQRLDPVALGSGAARAVPEGTAGARTVVHCGWPAPGTELRVVDPQTRQALEPGRVGEVWLRGPSVGAGYWGDEHATVETFRARLADGDGGDWLRTGDLGYVDATGGLTVTGRLKDVLIVQGVNHYPHDLEQTAEEAHPLLRPGCGAAFGVEAGGEERVVLMFEARERLVDAAALAEVVSAVAAALLEVHGVGLGALSLVRRGTIPKTTSGKIARAVCREAFLRGEAREVAAWASPAFNLPAAGTAGARPTPGRPAAGSGVPGARVLERALVEVVAARLGAAPEAVDPEATFAENGMDSAGLVEAAAVASRVTGQPVRPAHFFDHPTPAGAARALAGTPPAAKAGALPAAGTPRSAEARAPGAGARRDGGEAAAVAVVGIGCRFPGAADPEALWALLREGRDCIGPPPPGRRALGLGARVGAFLEDVAGFDAACFGIAPREAAWVDPQQRLLLEVTWEALEDGHLVPSRLAGGRVGVFVGISNSDYARLGAAHPPDAYAGTGTALSVAANRLSYTFDFQGPSVAVDTACSASLVAVHQAVASLRRGESEVAVAGGVNLVLAPYVTEVFDAAGMLSPEGRCRTFDDRADGYVRGEGCGVVVLERLEDALAAGHPVRAVILGSAVNSDGRTNGLTAPSGQAQRRVLRDALRDAGVEASRVRYVETHGTGTPLGDPVEFEALAGVFPGAPDGTPTYLGSVKTNLGHTESAAGVAGLIKAVLAVERGWLPPHLHFERPNRHLDLAATRLEVVTEGRPWPGGERVAGVSSFGFGGANAHVVVAAPPEPAARTRPGDAGEASCQILALSAHSRPALADLASAYADHLATTSDGLADVCWSARTGREHREHRLAVTGASAGEVAARLAAFAGQGGEAAAGRTGRDAPRVAFVFPGQGAEFPGMAAALAAASPVFRRELDASLQALDPHRRAPVEALLHGTADPADGGGGTSVAQPALFAFEYALARLWQSWGAIPAAVAGHSLGEYVAAALAGVFSPADGMRLVAARGALLDALDAPGAMAAVAAGVEEVEALVEPHAGRVCVAAVNGPRQVVIAGEAPAVRACVAEAAGRGLAARLKSERYAFHSHLVEPALDPYRAQVGLVPLHPPRVDFVAGTTGRPATGEVATPDYWARQLREPVRFAEAAATLAERGCRLVLEIGPSPVVTAFVRRATAGREPAVRCLPSLRRGEPPGGALLEALGQLWVEGAVEDLAALDLGTPAEPRRVRLPAYPFQRRHHWLPGPAGRPSPARRHPLLGTREEAGDDLDPGEHAWTRLLRPGDVALVDDHRIEGHAVLPGVAYLELALAAAREVAGGQGWEIADVEYASMLTLAGGREVRVRLSGQGSTRDFAVESRPAGRTGGRWAHHARGRVSPAGVGGHRGA